MTNIPFGYEQTIPSDRMTQLLASMVPAGSSVMEIGVGSGKLANVLASKCREVVGIEIQGLPDGAKLPENITLIQADGCKFNTNETFDCIVVSFGTDFIYEPWVKQLHVRGLLIVPVKVGGCCAIRVYQKVTDDRMELVEVPAYANFTSEVH